MTSNDDLSSAFEPGKPVHEQEGDVRSKEASPVLLTDASPWTTAYDVNLHSISGMEYHTQSRAGGEQDSTVIEARYL